MKIHAMLVARSSLLPCLLRALLPALLLCLSLPGHADDLKASLGAADAGHLEYLSANRHTTFRQAYRKQVVFDERIAGELRFPANPAPGKVPAIVIMHGSGGVTDSDFAWAGFFNDMGLATLVVDSFKPRGIQRSAEDQKVLSSAASAMDALKSLELLATHPAIDPGRIAIIGFSRGGGAALHASFERVRQAVFKDETRYAINFLFYPSCSEFAHTSGAPMHQFMGSEDSYNSVPKCRFNVDLLKSQGADIDLIVYEGGKHGFDTSGPPNFWVPLATTFKDCETGSLNLDTGIATMQDNRNMPAADFVKLREACIKRGLAVGSNAQYREQSRQAVKALLQKQFGL